MSAKGGRLEARTTNTSTWTATATDSGGARAISLAASNRYPVEVVAEMLADILAAGGAGWSISISDGEGSSATGRMTIDCSSEPWSFTWGSTDFRNWAGFTGDIASTTSAQTGTNAVQGLWLPGVPKFSLHGDLDNGRLITTGRSTINAKGQIHSIIGSTTHRRIEGIRWNGIAKARSKEHHETVTQESFESFYRAAYTGRYGYIPHNAYVRLYWDADVDATYAVGRLLWQPTLDMRTMIEGWTGRYNIELPPLVVEG